MPRAARHAPTLVLPLALLVAAAIASSGCRRDDADAPDAAPASSATAPSDAVRPEPSDAPAAVHRSLALAQAGWRFQLDIAEAPDGVSRLDVLAIPPTVGAAPLRWSTAVDAPIVEAFATDLDADAWPELLLWTRSGSAGEGSVEGWAMRPYGERTALTLPPLDDEHATGWRGRDQFGVQGELLVRSFPLYRDEDANASPSAGFVRVLRYRLEADGLTLLDTTLEPLEGTPQAEVLAR